MTDAPSETDPMTSWFLLGVAEGGRRIWRIPLEELPFRVGRRGGLHLTLPSDSVSSEHAEIYAEGSSLFVRDLGSTNGTFVNRDRIEQSPLEEGGHRPLLGLRVSPGQADVERGPPKQQDG